MENRIDSLSSPNPESKGLKINKDRIDDQIDITRLKARLSATSLVLACAGGVRGAFAMWGSSLSADFTQQHLPALTAAYSTVSTFNLSLNTVELVVIAASFAATELWARRKRGVVMRPVYGTQTKEYLAEPVVYRGKKPLDPFNVKRGDNLLFCALPKPEPGTVLTSEARVLYSQASIIALKEIREGFADYDYRAAIIATDNYIPQLKHADKVPNQQILAGKDIRPSESDSILVPSEDLEKLLTNPQSELQAALDKLGDPALNDYILLAKQASTPEQTEFITLEINRYLRRKLHDHSISQFAMPERKMMPHSRASAVDNRFVSTHLKGRAEKTVSLLTDTTGKLMIKMGNSLEGFMIRDLHSVIKIEEEVTVGELDPSSPHFKAQLYYSIYELFRKNPTSELTAELETDPRKIARELIDLGFPIARSKEALKTLADTKKRLDLIKQIERAILPIIAAAVIYTAGSSLEKITNNLDFSSITQITDFVPKIPKDSPVINSQSNISLHTTHKPNATGAPPHTLDWAINTPPDSGLEKGYFTLETSHQMEQGEWVISDERLREIQIPKPPERNGLVEYPLKDYIALSRWVELPYSPNFRFKLPIREGTTLAYLDIDLDDSTYKVYELTDGTIEIEIKQDLFDFENAAQIEAIFTKNENPAVKAASPIPKIDETKLDADNAQSIEGSKDNFSGETFLRSIAVKVKYSHQYSVRTQNSDRLKSASSGEEIVNIIAGDTLCNCDTCSTQANLETTIGQTDDSFSNQAFGYLSGVNQFNIGYQTFLTGDTFHGYMITNRGTIIDPTPSNIGFGDEETKTYLASITRNDDIENFYKNNSRLIGKRYSGANPGDFARVLRSVLGIGFLAGLGLGARHLLNNERRKQITGAAESVNRRLFLASLSKDDLQLAYQFFPWISYGMDTQMTTATTEGLTKDELLTKIQENHKKLTLEAYSSSPKTFEERAGITGATALKMRYISRFLN